MGVCISFELVFLLSLGKQPEVDLPCGSAGKESACNAGDLSLILGWEDPLEKGKNTHSSILA